MKVSYSAMCVCYVHSVVNVNVIVHLLKGTTLAWCLTVLFLWIQLCCYVSGLRTSWQVVICRFSPGVNMWLEHEIDCMASNGEAKVGNPFILVFPGWSWFYAFWRVGLSFPPNAVGVSNVLGFSISYNISDKIYNHFGFPHCGDNIHSSRITI